MANKAELKTAILKGFGLRPTSYLLRWTPTFRKPLTFDLVEVMRCGADGEMVTRKLAQSPRAASHLGHRLISPSRFSLFDIFKVQLRIIR